MKKYPSPSDIQEMRKKGYDPITIEAAEELLPRWQQLDELKQKISSAFNGVTLQEGIGLYEAQGMDDYASQAECLAYRAKDEKLNWHNISVDALNRCNSSLSFFDAQGMLFHLPAFLLASLNGDYLHDLTFTLTHEWHDTERKFSLFNTEQRAAVAGYLQILLDEPDYTYHQKEIMSALITGYWSGTVTA
ncbi:hypothetical protein KTJ32_00490 [Acinetobacter gyllenbergii]|uniref:DUF6714 family protein n=1 Tax=Acinetobacter gyllenbergii TaxID=134534 RepID=UPI0021CED248|nr:DUF6714 family protein [Acinetobacter gyllenbergii]MCU4579481.1 hypothetical protein [Acinetobacter gyllenbergii]